MDRVLVIGCPAAGKSTFSAALGERTKLPVVHLDRIYWRAGWVNVTNEEFDTLLERELIKPRYIIDGNYDRTLERRLEFCDTVIYLDYSRALCFSSAIARYLRNIGKTRPDMPKGCPEGLDLEFLRYIWRFNKNHRKRYYELFSALSHIEVVILKNRRAARRFLKSI